MYVTSILAINQWKKYLSSSDLISDWSGASISYPWFCCTVYQRIQYGADCDANAACCTRVLWLPVHRVPFSSAAIDRRAASGTRQGSFPITVHLFVFKTNMVACSRIESVIYSLPLLNCVPVRLTFEGLHWPLNGSRVNSFVWCFTGLPQTKRMLAGLQRRCNQLIACFHFSSWFICPTKWRSAMLSCPPLYSLIHSL